MIVTIGDRVSLEAQKLLKQGISHDTSTYMGFL